MPRVTQKPFDIQWKFEFDECLDLNKIYYFNLTDWRMFTHESPPPSNNDDNNNDNSKNGETEIWRENIYGNVLPSV